MGATAGAVFRLGGTGYRLSTLQREFSGDGQRRRVTPRLSSKKTTPPRGRGARTPPCPGPRFAFSLLLSPRLLPSPQSRPLHCLLFYITHFYSPRFPARTFSLRVSPPSYAAALPGLTLLIWEPYMWLKSEARLRCQAAEAVMERWRGRISHCSLVLFLLGGRIGGEVKAAQLAESILDR